MTQINVTEEQLATVITALADSHAEILRLHVEIARLREISNLQTRTLERCLTRLQRHKDREVMS